MSAKTPLPGEERAWLGLGLDDPLEPYALAREHRIRVYPIDELPDEHCPQQAVTHFTLTRPQVWSAALVPIGGIRMILENTGHAPVRRHCRRALRTVGSPWSPSARTWMPFWP